RAASSGFAEWGRSASVAMPGSADMSRANTSPDSTSTTAVSPEGRRTLPNCMDGLRERNTFVVSTRFETVAEEGCGIGHLADRQGTVCSGNIVSKTWSEGHGSSGRRSLGDQPAGNRRSQLGDSFTGQGGNPE